MGEKRIVTSLKISCLCGGGRREGWGRERDRRGQKEEKEEEGGEKAKRRNGAVKNEEGFGET